MNSSEIKKINNNDNNKPIGNLSLINLKEDILFFKNDILKDLKILETKLNMKFEGQSSLIKDNLNKYDAKMESITGKISTLGSQILTNTSLKEKVDELYEFKKNIKDNFLMQDIKIDSLMKDLNNAINRYDNILLESVIYSSIIGPNGKFKNFHELIDFILLNINQLNNYKEKNNFDLKSYKKKMETVSQNLKVQIESINKNGRDYTNKCIRELENKLNSFIDESNSKIMQVRMENNEYGKNLEEKATSLEENYKNVEKLKSDLEEKIKYEINKLADISENLQKEFSAIKKRFILLSDFIKNNKFQTNDKKNIVNQLKFNKKANNLIEQENPEKFNQEIKDINSDDSKISLNNNNNNVENCDVPLLKNYINGDVDLKELCQDRKKLRLIKQKSMKMKNLNCNSLSNDINDKDEIEIDTSKKETDKADTEKTRNNKILKSINSNPNRKYSNLKSKNYSLNYSGSEVENIKENNLKNEVVSKDRNINNGYEENKTNTIYSKLNKIGEDNNKNKGIMKLVDTSNKKEMNSKNKYQNKKNIIEKKINQYNYSFGFDINTNEIIKKYSPKNEGNDFGHEIITIINFNRKKPINSKEKKDIKNINVFENKKDTFEEETNNDKKLFELKNSLFNLNKKRKNNINNLDILSNTISIPNRKFFENKLLYFSRFKNMNLNKVKDLKKGSFNSDKNLLNNSNGSQIYKKITIKSNKNVFESEPKKLTPIRLRPNNSTNNLMEKRINEIELCYDEDKKIEKLIEKLKYLIPYEDNFSLSDRVNLGKINKNILLKKNFAEQKKDLNKNNNIFHDEKDIKNNEYKLKFE